MQYVTTTWHQPQSELGLRAGQHVQAIQQSLCILYVYVHDVPLNARPRRLMLGAFQ
jgi:hypothetical protein